MADQRLVTELPKEYALSTLGEILPPNVLVAVEVDVMDDVVRLPAKYPLPATSNLLSGLVVPMPTLPVLC